MTSGQYMRIKEANNSLFFVCHYSYKKEWDLPNVKKPEMIGAVST